ncbi:C4-dicarboxylate ABC transporter permease [Mesorhizobium sp. L-8-10]|uniref:TRAP transporter large permease n=1 Tax=Mesorhizobium sp. L-8-10 TaxID=2744523 RepID=UPI00192618B1|nr:TRAP transporter large permease [Mesorhizobium sp. L-8-10]BCH29109.1 C4-dicarboxylate ABC transporter permease [Mesorhizobium sp. L-8-10]
MLDPLTIGFVAIAAMLALSLIGVPVGIAMAAVAVVGLWTAGGSAFALNTLTNLPFAMASDYSFVVIPMFVLMGAIASASGITQELFSFSNLVLRSTRGALYQATILASAGFAAISGSTLVNAALFTRIALTEMLKLGYDRAFSAGCIAAAGTIAALIPPSISFVIYGLLTGESVAELLIAGVVPGVLTAAAYMIGTGVLVRVKTDLAPPPQPSAKFSEIGRSAFGLWATFLLAGLVIGGIYLGFTTPSGAGALGAIGALTIALARRRLSRADLANCLRSAAGVTAALFIVIIGGLMFTRFFLVAGTVTSATELLQSFQLSPIVFMLLLVAVFVVLGMFMDPLAMQVMTLPFVYPMVTALGYDGVWFGVIMVKLVELAVLSPPVGMNLFAVIGASEGKVKLPEIYRGIAPFIVIELIVLALLIAIPDLSLWLPRQMFN